MGAQAEESERRQKGPFPIGPCDGCDFYIWTDQGAVYTDDPPPGSFIRHSYHDDGCAPEGAVIVYRREAVGVSAG